MRVLMLSDQESGGGAAIATSRLAEALVGLGAEVIRVVGKPDGRRHPWKTEPLMTARERLAMTVMGKIAGGLRMWVVRWATSHRLKALLARIQPDVVNVHNLHSVGWGAELAALGARYAPTVWTLHDMWSFTGRCAYSYDCRRFISGCDGSCPTPGEYPSLDPAQIARAWKLRRQLFAQHADLVGVCPSDWLAQEARAGLWAGHRVEVIPNGLPLDRYVPLNRGLARAALGINSAGPVLLAAAQTLTERRKGGKIVIEAIEQIRNRPFALMTLGHGHLPIASEGIDLFSLGHIDHERTLVLAYNAADLLLHAAPVDNLPNVVMEAIACGTPCVGFSVGGVPDMIRVGTTGWLAREVTAGSLAGVVDDALTAIQQGDERRSSCRAVAEEEFDVQLQARRYASLFESL
jgi:glycosyltransferase involved in cell wall biosynthesis